MPLDDPIITPIFRSHARFIAWRAARVAEALSFEGGKDVENAKKHVIARLPCGKEAYFLKPGKETERENPNVHDMFPDVAGETSKVRYYRFDHIWEYLLNISIINQITFKKTLTLLYRMGFLMDHCEERPGIIRYAPAADLSEYIKNMEFSLRDGFKDKFKTEEQPSLSEFLHFMDLLSWNEDVKYHVTNGMPDFSHNPNRGRTNTILSVISVPLLINDFLFNIMENVSQIEKINVRLILATMQQLSKSRGICALSSVKLRGYLAPYLRQQ